MCFPGKRLKNNHSDDDDKPAPAKSPSSALAPAVTTAPATTMSAPKVAIVIYTLYGHIAKRTSYVSSYHPTSADTPSSR